MHRRGDQRNGRRNPLVVTGHNWYKHNVNKQHTGCSREQVDDAPPLKPLDSFGSADLVVDRKLIVM